MNSLPDVGAGVVTCALTDRPPGAVGLAVGLAVAVRVGLTVGVAIAAAVGGSMVGAAAAVRGSGVGRGDGDPVGVDDGGRAVGLHQICPRSDGAAMP